jgi:hypothetical protein
MPKNKNHERTNYKEEGPTGLKSDWPFCIFSAADRVSQVQSVCSANANCKLEKACEVYLNSGRLLCCGC